MKPSKSEVAFAKVKFSGHIVGNNLLRPQIETLEKIRAAKRPEARKEVCSFLDLKKFLSTNSTIWTYYSTQNRQLLCLNDAMVNIMEKSVVLNRSYYEGPEWHYTTVEWVFLETERTKITGFYACMLHNELDNLHFIVQCIRYHNESSQCAVMEYQVRSLKGDMPQSSLLYPSPTAAKKEGNMAGEEHR
ncbi:hypothetical protein MRX96_029975 [Rhipicephalus microplus]